MEEGETMILTLQQDTTTVKAKVDAVLKTRLLKCVDNYSQHAFESERVALLDMQFKVTQFVRLVEAREDELNSYLLLEYCKRGRQPVSSPQVDVRDGLAQQASL